MGKPGGVRCLGGSPDYRQEHPGLWDIMSELEKSKLWARCWNGPFIHSLLWEEGWERPQRGRQKPWLGWKLGGSLGEEESYREVSLVDPQEKDQLGQAQGSCEVASDAMLVGAKGTKKGEEEEGDGQGS